MTTHSSATVREETLHVTETTTIISNALKRRAHSVINDTSIDPQWRAIVRYGLETNDPWLGDLVRRADAGEPIIDTVDFSLEPESNNDDSNEEKIEALAEMICRSWRRICGRAVCAHGNVGKLHASQTTCEHGETLCLHSLR